MSSITIETYDTTVVITTRAPQLTVLEALEIAPAANARQAGYTITDEGTVIDNTSGLEWQRTPFAGEMPWDAAASACKELRLAGHEDWRMPTRVELLTLVDDTRFDPAIDADAFPDTPTKWFWTSTPAARAPSAVAWIVRFANGSSGFARRDGHHRVRAVRGASRQ